MFSVFFSVFCAILAQGGRVVALKIGGVALKICGVALKICCVASYLHTLQPDWEGDFSRMVEDFGDPIPPSELAFKIRRWLEQKKAANCPALP